jgi:hypothetical protein
MWSAGSSGGTALEHREWQAEAADNVRLYNDNALWNRSSSFIDDSCYSAKVRLVRGQQDARCADCRHTYHVWGHVRRFRRVREVRELFPGFVLRIHAFCGRENSYMTPPGLWIRQRLGGRWAIEETAVCPKCGSRSQSAAGLPRRAIAGLVDRIEQRLPHAWAFWWLVCLFERAPEASNGAGQALAP